MRYVAQRLIRAALLLIGVSILCFAFTEFAPGDFFDEMRLNPQISPETVAALRAQYGLGQSLAVRYAKWSKAALHGDLGYSFAYNEPVTSLLWPRMRNTLLLTTTAMFLAWMMAVPLGVWTAARAGGSMDRIATAATSLLISIPEIVIALALLGFAVRTRLAPVGGMVSASFDDLSRMAKARDVLSHLLIPAAILTLASLPVIVRHIRSSVLEVIDAPFIEAARGHGIGGARLLFRHVLPVASHAAISLFGFSLAGLLSGSLLVEVITGWPGLGPLILDSTLSRDLFVVIGAVMYAAVFMLAGNIVADLLLVATDPRIRTGASHE